MNFKNDCKVTLNARKCNFFPCSLLRSYTSIVGPKNDRRIKTAPSRRPDDTRKSFNFKSKIKSDTQLLEEDFNFAKSEYELSKIELENFEKKISLRRPVREINSVNDLNSRIDGIETRVRFNKEKNFTQLKQADRNLRYGAEPFGKLSFTKSILHH